MSDTFVFKPLEDCFAGLSVGGNDVHSDLVADGLNGLITDDLLQKRQIQLIVCSSNID